MAFIWGEATRFIVTLLAAVLGLIAVLMLPGERRIREGMVGGYMRSGRWLVLVLGVLLLAAAAGLGYEWLRLRQRDFWVTGNLLLLSVLGAAILAGNFWTMRLIKRAAEGEVLEVEAVEVAPAEAQGGGAGEAADAAAAPAETRGAGTGEAAAAGAGGVESRGGGADGEGGAAPAAGDAGPARESSSEGAPGGPSLPEDPRGRA